MRKRNKSGNAKCVSPSFPLLPARPLCAELQSLALSERVREGGGRRRKRKREGGIRRIFTEELLLPPPPSSSSPTTFGPFWVRKERERKNDLLSSSTGFFGERRKGGKSFLPE